MKVWLVTIGEPLPVQQGVRDRLHRTGYFAHFLAEKGHDVTWWTSTFEHFRKEHVFLNDTVLKMNDRLRIVFIRGSGYSSNVSLSRIRDHRLVARKFSNMIQEEKRAPDILLAALPTVELSLAAVRYGEKRSIPVVLDMRDMWPDIFVDSVPAPVRGLARMALAPMYRNARLACARATAIVGITDEFVKWGLERGLRQQTDLDRSFAMGYTSVPPTAENLRRAEQFWDEKGLIAGNKTFTACFIGTLGRQGDLVTVLESAKVLQRLGSGIRFVICGLGDRSSEFTRMGAGLDNVIFPGWIDAACIHVLMRRSHVGLDPLSQRYDFLATINNKAIEYLSANLPVISSPKRGTLFELLRRQGCGLSYDICDAGGLADILLQLDRDRELLQRLSAEATRTFSEFFTAEKVYGQMMDHLELLVDRHHGTRSGGTGGQAGD